MDFLASKEMSLFCFFLNEVFLIWMIISGELLLSLVPLVFGLICLNNALK
jgi:hypothetical protein